MVFSQFRRVAIEKSKLYPQYATVIDVCVDAVEERIFMGNNEEQECDVALKLLEDILKDAS